MHHKELALSGICLIIRFLARVNALGGRRVANIDYMYTQYTHIHMCNIHLHTGKASNIHNYSCVAKYSYIYYTYLASDITILLLVYV